MRLRIKEKDSTFIQVYSLYHESENDCRDFNDYSPNLWRKNIDVLLNIVREIDTTINQRTLMKRLNVFFRMSYQVKSIMISQKVL